MTSKYKFEFKVVDLKNKFIVDFFVLKFMYQFLNRERNMKVMWFMFTDCIGCNNFRRPEGSLPRVLQHTTTFRQELPYVIFFINIIYWTWLYGFRLDCLKKKLRMNHQRSLVLLKTSSQLWKDLQIFQHLVLQTFTARNRSSKILQGRLVSNLWEVPQTARHLLQVWSLNHLHLVSLSLLPHIHKVFDFPGFFLYFKLKKLKN